MNRKEIENFLFSARQDDTPEIYRRAMDVLESHNVEGYLEVIAQTMTRYADDSTDQIVTLVGQDLDFSLRWILKVQSIELVEDLMLTDVIQICEDVEAVAGYEDAATMRQVLEADSVDPDDAVFSCLSLATGRDTTYYSTRIRSMHPGLGKALLNLILSRAEAMEDVPVTEPEQIQAWQAFARAEPELAGTSYGSELLASPEMVGMPFANYWPIWMGTRFKSYDLENADHLKAIVGDLYGLACLSIDRKGDALIAVREVLGKLTPEVNVVTQLSVMAQQLATSVAAGEKK